MTRTGLLLVITLAAAAGMLGYSLDRYRGGTLILQARSLEAGTRTIEVAEKGSGKSQQLTFEFGSADGEPGVYAIELPRMALGAIRIPPLAGVGRYEIDRVTLAVGGVSYGWDENLACTRREGQEGPARKEPCTAGSPGISVADRDGTVVIASLPEADFRNSVGHRLGVALALAGMVLAGGLFLLGRDAGRPGDKAVLRFATRAAWLAVALLYGYQLYMLVSHAIDIPYYEEWAFFDPAALPRGLTWQWLATQVSHQRMMVFTKLMAWLDYRLFDLDFVKLKVMNYLFFGALLAAVARFRKRVLGNGLPLFPLFMVFLLSPITYEVHAASFQSGETFAVLCSAVMLLTIAEEHPSWQAALIFSLAAVAGMYSLSAGVIYALVFLIADTSYGMMLIKGNRPDRTARLRSLLLRWAITFPAILFWFLGLKKPEAIWNVPPWLLPVEGRFWGTFLELLSFGLGFETDGPFPGLLCLLILVTPVVLLLCRKESRWQASTWQVAAAIAGSLAVVALITVGRGNMGFSIKVPRYAIFGLLLVPYGAMAWWLAVRERKWRAGMLAAFWCFFAVSFYNDWDYGIYRDVMLQEKAGLECVERYANGTGDGICPESNLLPIGGYFDNARALGVRFTRQFAAPPPERLP